MHLRRTWICDSCGQRIDGADEGWVEWLVRQEGDRPVGRGLRLVHRATVPEHPGCQYRPDDESKRDGSLVHGGALAEFVTCDGLTRLLSMIAGGEVPNVELLEMIKRLHSPGYEYAWRHIDAAIAAGVIQPSARPGYYSLSQLLAVNEWRARTLDREVK
jgi:hypothetical protein